MKIQTSDIFATVAETHVSLLLFGCAVPAGFPSPAEDWVENTLDLNDLLVKNPPATFLIRVKGDSMKNIGILDGALLVVDRSIQPKKGMIVVADVAGELTVKRYTSNSTGLCLHAENPNYRDIQITEDTTIWGVVKSTITQF